MTVKEQLIEVRDSYIALIKNELYGPGSEFAYPDIEHELITTPPEKRYSIGVLFPQSNHINSESSESMRVEENVKDLEDASRTLLDTDDVESDIGTDRVSANEHDSDDSVMENLDEEIGLASQNLPSSMGISFIIKGNCEKISGDFTFATYKRARLPDCRIPIKVTASETYCLPSQVSHIVAFDAQSSSLILLTQLKKKEVIRIFETDTIAETDYFMLKNAIMRLCDQLQTGFVREPHRATFEINFDGKDYIDDNTNLDGTTAKITAIRRSIGKDLWSVTVMAVNDLEGKPNGINCILQPKISISTSSNLFVFSELKSEYDFLTLDMEEQSLDMLYRTKKIYGSGLGTSIGWEVDGNGKGVVFSDFFPESEVPSMDFELPTNDLVDESKLSMKYLSDLDGSPKAEKISSLKNIVKLYENWINELETKLKHIPQIYHDVGKTNINECKSACERMLAGIDTLEKSEDAWSSFLLSNRAMFMQREQLRLQYETSNEDRYPDDEQLSKLLSAINYAKAADKHQWRPFQIAFLLMDINSIVNDTGEERNLVDLIWFPTGGGKTEAYLGLTAFTIFYRRLKHLTVSNGTAVMMRYTLRLLAAQQFTRAATLICACEFIRQDGLSRKPVCQSYALGSEPITIGLWIGGEHTPNKNEKAEKCIKKLLESSASSVRNVKDKYNKFQVLKCPWCGTKLVKDVKEGRLVGQWGYKMRDGKHFYMSCPQEECHFNQLLPIQIVDEELYLAPPTLLFGTVDKFAMLPWESSVGAFFASDTNNRAPELIIQDELHLISGPLGTIVGLYETVIDSLCKSKGTNSKIIASTATIRRAKEQCSALYNRNVVQFPAPGLDTDDSFFARESKTDYKKGIFGRKYVGLMPSGKTKAMMEVRTIAALLQKAKSIELSDEIKDKIWTLTVYFNSLKDLGKCTTLVDDDIKDFMIRMAIRLGSRFDARQLVGADELTSRVSTTELNETLDKLEKLEYSKENIQNKKYASNILLATNMISVGIDVARLNVMLLVGQPKLTSEYIQASSRVGRSFPGTAFAMYDGSKSRDRSHFEQFKAYHESFYRFVEPTGVTPFSKPARDRALHAVMTSLIRYNTGLGKDSDAINFDLEYHSEQIKAAKQFVLKRLDEINKRASDGVTEDISEVESEIDLFLNEWQRLVETAPNKALCFGRKFMVKSPSKDERRLLKAFGTAPYETYSMPTLTSMRNVDSSVAGNILIWED